MKVRSVTANLATRDGRRLRTGDTVDVDDATAQAWVRHGLAEQVEAPRRRKRGAEPAPEPEQE